MVIEGIEAGRSFMPPETLRDALAKLEKVMPISGRPKTEVNPGKIQHSTGRSVYITQT